MRNKTNKKITIGDLAVMIKKGFDENTEQHQRIFGILDNHAVMLVNHTETLKDHTERFKKIETKLVDHTERLKRIETKLEGVVYRKEFEELDARVKTIEAALAIKPSK